MDFIYGCAISQVCWAKITETVLKMFKSKQSKKQLSDIIDKAQRRRGTLFQSSDLLLFFFITPTLYTGFCFLGPRFGILFCHLAALSRTVFLLPWPKRWIVNKAPPQSLLQHILLYMFLCCLFSYFFLIKHVTRCWQIFLLLCHAALSHITVICNMQRATSLPSVSFLQ